MSLLRSRHIPKAHLTLWEAEKAAVAQAEQEAEKILEEAAQEAVKTRDSRQEEGRNEAEAELARQLIQTYQARDTTIRSIRDSSVRILTDACARVLGQGDWANEISPAVDGFLEDLRAKELLALQLPKKPRFKKPPWLTWHDKKGPPTVLDGDLTLCLEPEFNAEDLLEEGAAQPTGVPRLAELVRTARPVRLRGTVHELTGLVLQASVAGVRMGEVCEISDPDSERVVPCEVVGFRGNHVMLMPLGESTGIGPDSEVAPTGRPVEVRCGWSLLGRVLDGLGRPIDGGTPLTELADLEPWAVEREAPDPLGRQRITRSISLGVKAIDGLLTVGEGQRIGIFAGSGVGKSTLMGQIARNTEAEVVIVSLIGERGREVRDFIEESLGEEGMKKSVVVCATSDMPSLVRLKSAFVATAIAEWFRDQGAKVLFMMDSATRFARSQREIGLALGEPPARQGYPPSVFAQIPRLMERTGNSSKGSITALYTVLVQASDMEEPIADEVRGILDGHIILNRDLGARNHWPAIDILPSLSRVMTNVASEEHKKAAGVLRETLAAYEKQRDLILLGAYEYGSDDATDYAIDRIEEIESFLRQGTQDNQSLEETSRELIQLFADRF